MGSVHVLDRSGNAGFFAAGPSPRSISDADLHDQLLHEFPQWLTAARAAGIVLSR